MCHTLSYSADHFLELDDYFSRVPLFVPGSHVELKDPAAREEELRQGRIVVGGHEDDVRIDEDEKEKV